MLSNEVKLEVLHAHYVDTFAEIKVVLRERNKLFLLILVLITVMLLQIVAPDESDTALSQLVATKLGLVEPVNVSVVGSVIWFALLWLVIRYFQAVAQGERLLDYIHTVEDQLGEAYGDSRAFTREGRAYLSNYGLFSKWVRSLYTRVFPGLLAIVLLTRLWRQYSRSIGHCDMQLAFDTIMCGAILISTVLYLRIVQRHRTDDEDSPPKN